MRSLFCAMLGFMVISSYVMAMPDTATIQPRPLCRHPGRTHR